MITPWLAFALAGPPAELDLDDLQGPTERVAAALSGPEGCWEARGERIWAWWERDGGWDDGQEPARATLNHGVWRGTEAWAGFQPVVGRVTGADRDPGSVVAWLAALHGEVETSWLRWDDDRAVLVFEEALALEEPERVVTRRAHLSGDVVQWAEATYPPVGLGRGAHLVGAGWEVRFAEVNGVVVPVEEFVAVRVRSGGRLVRGHQVLRWSQWTPCGSPQGERTTPESR